MKIAVILEVEDPRDLDPHHSTGLTSEAYDRLYEAITDAGFEFVSGPDKVHEEGR